ncbi:exsB protein [Methanobacterium lacus]|uniref:7-cyano-7-deazaguanine synthase n=1 Tax=Methanobacterium lacus (strain AL-21) TaxID=877455 RepID=F0T922_METLA|nr:7-cyano-7-deazaguanine synthase QueC [Methanobacterium lacus]ADZ08644.1 exsB protein [Methanobacterium lacus]
MKKKAITVLSGGLDSTVASAKFREDYQIHALTFNYGQKSAEMEIKSAKAVCKELGAEHTVIELPWLAELGNSALTSEESIPEPEDSELDDIESALKTAKSVWVPGRNVVFTAIANSFAEAENASIIIVGWDLEEAVTFPDNSKEFLEAFNTVLEVGSFDVIKIEAPLIGMNKNEIVEYGDSIGAPMELSYSCYKGLNYHCGVCESCMRRKRAFKNTGVEDKTVYSEDS